MNTDKLIARKTRRWIGWVVLAAFSVVLLWGTCRNSNFWFTADQRAQWLIEKHRYAEATKTGASAWWTGIAYYRDGSFEAAARTFARVPGAEGAFNQGGAWLMHGKYADAVASYDRALAFRPGWPEALENKALALARQALLDASGEDRTPQKEANYEPDGIVYDQKESNPQAGSEPDDHETESSEQAWRAQWLRQVQTTPADFLRAKFAHQAATTNQEAAP